MGWGAGVCVTEDPNERQHAHPYSGILAAVANQETREQRGQECKCKGVKAKCQCKGVKAKHVKPFAMPYIVL